MQNTVIESIAIDHPFWASLQTRIKRIYELPRSQLGYYNLLSSLAQMAKKRANKNSKASAGKTPARLSPGKKKCRQCGTPMAINKRVCSSCGHLHEMRKKKEEIMSNLRKITPIMIKSIIENNDFNTFEPWKEQHIYQVGYSQRIESNAPTQALTLSRKRSKQPEPANPTQFRSSNDPSFKFLWSKYPISCLAATREYFAYVEQHQKVANNLTENEELTIRAFRLQNFHCHGIDYSGAASIKFNQSSTPDIFDEILVKNHHVKRAKIYCNLMVLLTGSCTLIAFSLPVGACRKTKTESLRYELTNYTEILEPKPDKITAFQFLRGYFQDPINGIAIVVGTALGHMSVYRIFEERYSLLRYFPNAHNEIITCLSECPLNSKNEGVLFASGSYDGSVSIWDMKQKHKIYSFESSNRKVWSIVWDPGAKFLLVTRDESSDSSIIGCFYSITKIETKVELAPKMEIRTVRNLKNRSITHHDFYASCVPSLDPVRGYFKLLSLEELRGNSLKKKKPKKEEVEEKLYHITLEQGSIDIDKIGVSEEAVAEDKNSDKSFPVFSDLCIQSQLNSPVVYMSTLEGGLIRYEPQK